MLYLAKIRLFLLYFISFCTLLNKIEYICTRFLLLMVVTKTYWVYELAFAISFCPPETWKISTGQRCSSKRRKKR